MRIEQCFDENELGRLLPKLGEVKDTVWRTLSLQGFEPPTASIVTRILFLVTMILKPFQSLWTVCFHLIFLVEPEDCPVCARLKRRRKKPHLLLHCPHCWEPMHSRGTNGRTPVFFCPRHGRVSMRRTLEARVFFALYAIRVSQLVAAGIPEKDVAELLGVTRTFVETAVRTLAARLDLPAPPPEGRPRGPLPGRLLREQDRRPRGEGGKTRALDLRRGEHPDHTLPPRKDQEEPAGGSHTRRGDRRKSRLHRPREERLPRLHPRETLPQDLGRGHRPLPPPGQGLLPPRPHRHAPAKEEGQGDRVGGGEGEPAQAEEGRGRPQRRAGEAPQRDRQHKRQREVRREAPRSASPAASAASPT